MATRNSHAKDETVTTTADQAVRLEDVAGVRSRISWQAVLAGAVIALAANMVITFFLAALGLSLTEAGVRENTVGWGALIAVILGLIVSLFIGGWVTVQLTAGETEQESILYGILTWATVLALTFALIGMGLRAAGSFALAGATLATQSPEARGAQNWEQALRNSGVPQERIDAARGTLDPNRSVAPGPDVKPAEERAREAAIAGSWAALVGILLSMVACIGGAMVGRGPAFRLFPVARIDTPRRELIVS
jgi:hypothetical protein